jgi:hypothetical protein
VSYLWGTHTRGDLAQALRRVAGVRVRTRAHRVLGETKKQFYLERPPGPGRPGLTHHFFYTDGSDDDWIDKMTEALVPEQVIYVCEALRVDPAQLGVTRPDQEF